jgi:hypothetical protein
MRAELKRLHSPDICNLDEYVPAIQDSFGFLLQIFAGPESQDDAESFDVFVCTPKWLTEKLTGWPVLVGRHHLFVKEYDFTEIRSFIEGYCLNCSGEIWQEVTEKLGRLGKWEFEEYVRQPDL